MGIRNIFIRRVIEKKVAAEVTKELSDKSLAQVSVILRGMIRVAGVPAMRSRVIKSITDDLVREVKSNKDHTVESLMQSSLVQTALHTPEYMELLTELGMNEDHIRALAQEVITNAK